jgi:hypothetical protein
MRVAPSHRSVNRKRVREIELAREWAHEVFLDFTPAAAYFAPRSGKNAVHGCDGWFPVHTGGKIDR